MYDEINIKNNRYIVYARRSSESEDRQVASTHDQIEAMKKVVDRDDDKYRIVKTYEEQKSGFIPYKREKFDEMINLIRSGKANGIITWKLSRLSRNPEEAGIIMGMLQRGLIQHIRTVNRHWLPTDNIINPSVEFAMSNQSSIETSTDTKRGMREKAERGWSPHSQLVMGYMHISYYVPGVDPEIAKDPTTFELFREGIMHIIEGRKEPREALRWLTAQGLRVKRTLHHPEHPMPYSSFYRTLGDRFYLGEFVFKGKLYYGKHQKMFTEEEWDKLQFVLGRKDRPRPKRHFFPFSGLMHCGECGASIVGDPTIKILKDGTVRKYLHYRCSKRKGPCSQKTISKPNIDKAFLEFLGSIKIPNSFHQWAIKQLQDEQMNEVQSRQLAIERNRILFDEVEKKLDMLIDMKLSQQLSEDEYNLKRNKLEKEKNVLKILLDESQNRQDEWIKKLDKKLDFAKTAKAKFESNIPEVQKEIMFNLGSNYILYDRKVTLDIDSPLLLVQKIVPEVNMVLGRLEPGKNIDDQGVWEDAKSQNIIWGQIRDVVINLQPEEISFLERISKLLNIRMAFA